METSSGKYEALEILNNQINECTRCLLNSEKIHVVCGENISSFDYIGKLIDCNGQKIYPLRHPSVVLYNPSFKQTMILDFKRVSILLKSDNE